MKVRYGDEMSDYNLCDTRYLQHEHRFMLTHNKLDPKVYTVTKVETSLNVNVTKVEKSI